MNSRYWRYLGGAAVARTGDEMSGPALLLLGFAVTGSAVAGSALLAGLTVAAALGGPAFGVLIDRSPRPERVLAATLGAYALGIGLLLASVGRLALPVVVGIALVTGLFAPAVAGGWTSQVPRLVSGEALSRASALDALTFTTASLIGPALAALIAAWAGARLATGIAAALVALAVPAALSIPGAVRIREPPAVSVRRQLADGFAAILARPRLRRATATSVVSFIGIGMLIVCCPVLGQQRLGASTRGALLISAMAVAALIANSILARWPARVPDRIVFASTLVLCLAMAAAAVAPGWFTMLAVAVGGAGDGPQLTALLAVRHREAPVAMRGQIFTTAASLKIGGLAVGSALAGPLASRSLTTCLLVAAVTELCAAVTYAITG
ncbi:MAG: MFS transporter [Streptosporangiaceae bacterium]